MNVHQNGAQKSYSDFLGLYLSIAPVFLKYR